MSVSSRLSLLVLVFTLGCSGGRIERGKIASAPDANTSLNTPCFDAEAECGANASCVLSRDGIQHAHANEGMHSMRKTSALP